MLDNARNCVKDTTLTTLFFIVLFSLILLQQLFCKVPAKQIIISAFN